VKRAVSEGGPTGVGSQSGKVAKATEKGVTGKW
jgi:hypothetical protein